MKYNWQQADWPHFRYDLSALYDKLLAIAEKVGRISGKLAHSPQSLQTEALMDLMLEEAVKTSEIEGEYLSRPDIRSSIKNKLGLNQKKVVVHDKRASGMVDLLFDVRDTFQKPLSKTMLLNWHFMLLSHSYNPHLQIASWRTHTEPMQVVGFQGQTKVHFEAPPSTRVPQEMQKFMRWFNATAPGKIQAIKFAPVRAAIAHLYFESIHPFEDGNGRIGRAIAEKALSQGYGYPVLFSLSPAIEADKKAYYLALHAASQTNEITPWLHYFVDVILKAQINIENQITFILKKAVFFDTYQDQLNERQLKVVRRMMLAGVKGFEGGMSAKKYMTITGTSKATATRDLQQLQALQIFKQVGDGRSIRYELDL
jgi:Fic family protein